MNPLKWLLLCVVFGFASASEIKAAALPEGVRIIKAGGAEFQLRFAGLEHKGPAVVLLSGPNEHWHSDSGWFALLQPVLATKYRTYAVDRLGQGLSSEVNNPSYSRFAKDLALVMSELNESEILLLSFASSSISSLLLAQQNSVLKIQGLLLIDPDIPLPHSIALYKGYPADWYKANLAELLPALKTGIWTERTAKKLQQERQQVQKLIPEHYASLMDWGYFDFMAQLRLRIERQQSRAKEIAAYAADLDLYQQLPLYSSRPVSVLNTDFEQKQLMLNPAQKSEIRAWQREGDEWSQLQAKRSGGQYIELQHSDHLVIFQRPAVVIQAVDWLMALP
jgi:pimeloyl-ACP methyl ester carboxylesterase